MHASTETAKSWRGEVDPERAWVMRSGNDSQIVLASDEAQTFIDATLEADERLRDGRKA